MLSLPFCLNRLEYGESLALDILSSKSNGSDKSKTMTGRSCNINVCPIVLEKNYNTSQQKTGERVRIESISHYIIEIDDGYSNSANETRPEVFEKKATPDIPQKKVLIMG